MPYNLQLTWHDPRKCWKKFHAGKRFYLGKGQCRGKTDIEGYRIALAEWEGIKRKLGIIPHQRQRLPAMAAVDLEMACHMATDYGGLSSSPDVASPLPITEARIDRLAEIFIARQRVRADSGEIGIDMYSQYKYKLEDFVAYAKHRGRQFADEIDASLLDVYRSYQLQLIDREDDHHISAFTAKRRLDATRLFVRWLYRQELLDRLPRNLDEQYARISLPTPTPLQYTCDEVRSIFGAATRRTKLYIALALNCGYTQVDIASLQHAHIDWTAGTIRRKRHKTEIEQVHKLWPVTVELLKLEKSGGGEGIALLDEDGKLLVRKIIKADGKPSKYDTIRLAFDRTMQAAGMKTDSRRFKTFRKTSSNEIERAFPEYPHLASQFLAHGETATKRYYVSSHFDLLFKAIDHLDRLFALKIEPATA